MSVTFVAPSAIPLSFTLSAADIRPCAAVVASETVFFVAVILPFAACETLSINESVVPLATGAAVSRLVDVTVIVLPDFVRFVITPLFAVPESVLTY